MSRLSLRYAPVLAVALVGAAAPYLLARQAGDSVEFTAPPGSGKPFLTKAANGDLLLSWLEARPNGAAALRFARRNGGRWSEPRTIIEGKRLFVNWADFPSIVESGNRLFVHWLEKTEAKPYAYHIRVAVSSSGGQTWLPARTLHTDLSPTEHGFASMVPDSDGTVDAAWLDGRRADSTPPGPTALRFATLGPDGKATGETELDRMTCDCCQVAMARTDRGLIVAYRNRTEVEVRDIMVVRQLSGKWTEPSTVADDGWTIKACPVNGPSIAARGQRVAVAWYTAADDKPQVKVAFSTNGGASFGRPVLIDGAKPLGRVQIAILPNGSAAVIWLKSGDRVGDWRMRQLDFDGKSGPLSSLATTTLGRDAGFSRVVVEGNQLYLALTQAGADSTPSRARVYRAALSR